MNENRVIKNRDLATEHHPAGDRVVMRDHEEMEIALFIAIRALLGEVNRNSSHDRRDRLNKFVGLIQFEIDLIHAGKGRHR